MVITNDIKYIGVYDKDIDLFEGLYKVPDGISYNSYLIFDEKIAVLDTVDVRFANEWLKNLRTVLCGRKPDYIIIQHMEPDHSANIMEFMNEYPETTVVSSSKAFAMMKDYFGNDFAENRLVVGEGDTLPLGKHTLTFFTAPMVHWPEVIVTYDKSDKVLFSADAFGTFGFPKNENEWTDEARRYYIGIVGKYGVQAAALLKKVATLDIEIICSLHGPVLKDNLEHYINKYNLWSGYEPETDGILIAYTSIYGNTKKAALNLAEEIKANGQTNVEIIDLARSDMTAAVSKAFKYSKLVLATTTYNMGIFPFMREFINKLTERNFGNRTVAFIENGSWAPMATKIMKTMLEGSKNITYADAQVTIRGAVNEHSTEQIKLLAREISC